jgi:hypothetical protein
MNGGHLTARRTLITGVAADAAAAAAAAFPVSALAKRSSAQGYAEAPDGRVWWRRVGDGPGTPLLLLHGGPGAGRTRLEATDALARAQTAANTDVVAIYKALGGAGRST